jgi:uncharacterized protein (DUF305 family)
MTGRRHDSSSRRRHDPAVYTRRRLLVASVGSLVPVALWMRAGTSEGRTSHEPAGFARPSPPSTEERQSPGDAASTTTTSEPAVSTPTLDHELYQGTVDPKVRELQARLTDLAFDPGPVDGYFGAQTLRAVWAFDKLVLDTSREAVTGVVSWALWDRLFGHVEIEPRRNPGGTHLEIYLPEQVAALFVDGAIRLVTHVSSGTSDQWCDEVVIDDDDGSQSVRGICGVSVTPGGVFHFERKVDGWRNAPLGRLYKPVYFNYGIAIHGPRTCRTIRRRGAVFARRCTSPSTSPSWCRSATPSSCSTGSRSPSTTGRNSRCSTGPTPTGSIRNRPRPPPPRLPRRPPSRHRAPPPFRRARPRLRRPPRRARRHRPRSPMRQPGQQWPNEQHSATPRERRPRRRRIVADPSVHSTSCLLHSVGARFSWKEPPMSHRITPAVVVALVAVTAACAGDDGSPAPPTADEAVVEAEPPADDSFGSVDVDFAQGMIPHHAQALDMADIALDPEMQAGAEVIDLATRVRDAQDPEIQMMAGWLDRWGHPMDPDSMMGMDQMDHEAMGHSMDGMMSDDQMNELRNARGSEFDRLWLELMIEHHEGAVRMSRQLLDSGESAEARDLAEEIIAAQEAEIDEMRALLDG